VPELIPATATVRWYACGCGRVYRRWHPNTGGACFTCGTENKQLDGEVGATVEAAYAINGIAGVDTWARSNGLLGVGIALGAQG
jgi:hypothetical protein